MNSLSRSALYALLLLGLSAHAANRETDKKQVDTACRKDADKIGCKGMTMGNGLGRCMFEYRKKHPDFRPAEACKTAMKQLRQDNVAERTARGAGPGAAGNAPLRKGKPGPGK